MNIHNIINHSLLQELSFLNVFPESRFGLHRSEDGVEQPLTSIHSGVNRQIAKDHTIVETLSFMLKLYP